jgi:hypothetical protein
MMLCAAHFSYEIYHRDFHAPFWDRGEISLRDFMLLGA